MAATHFSGLAVAPVVVTDAATYTVLAGNSGKVHVMPDLTATCTLTLPRAAAGLSYTFLYAGAAADAQNWVINTGATSEVFKGGVVHLDSDADAAGDEVVAVYSNGSTHDTLTVVTPGAGTYVTMVSNGTSWYLTGYVVSATVPTLA